MVGLPVGTVTFVFTDIEGSTRLVERLRDDYPSILADHAALLREGFRRRPGRRDRRRFPLRGLPERQGGGCCGHLLGHIDLDTTRGYTAVFQDDLIARHQQFITRRRTLRDSSEYRDITAEEWAEFEKHFQLRRVALGDCFRPYGTPCVHEHACIRCPHLRLDPTQKPLLDDIEANTRLRLAEANEKGWLGETAALEETLHHIGRKRTQLPTRQPTATPRRPTS